MPAHLKIPPPSSGWLSPTSAWASTSTTSPAWGRSQRLWWRGATSPPTGRRRKSLLVSSAGFHCPLFLVSLWVSYLLIVVLWHLEQVAYNLGLGSLTWVVATEVLPIRLEFQKTERQSKTWFQGPAVGLTPWPTSPPTSAGSSSPRRSGTCRTPSATPLPSFSMAEFVSSGSSSSSSSFRRPGERLRRKPLSLSLVSSHFLIGSVHKPRQGEDSYWSTPFILCLSFLIFVRLSLFLLYSEPPPCQVHCPQFAPLLLKFTRDSWTCTSQTKNFYEFDK